MKLIIGLLAALALAAPAVSAAQGTEEHDVSFQRTRAKTVTATVKAIDQKTRMVTLRGSDGKDVTFKADEKIKNLPQVKVGDVVVADYYESVAIYVSKPDGAGAASGVSTAVATAKPGEMPAAVVGRDVTLVATVESIASDKTSVTLKGSDGKTTVLPVKNPENLEAVKVGDQVTIIASQALAVSVEKAPAKAKGKAPAKAPAAAPAEKPEKK